MPGIAFFFFYLIKQELTIDPDNWANTEIEFYMEETLEGLPKGSGEPGWS